MTESLLYERSMAHGPAVRIRRTSAEGATPVTAVLEVDRRAGTPREGEGTPPPLLHCEAATESAILDVLGAHARDDRMIVQLLHEKGLR
ncbi:MAG TPA: hypothetical protein VHV78_01905 [Gemmatimonadaceae bacterium]|jgi:hypothetical protein|nr:hypothetical protein [Gemmatimonadaceae bacterium]